LWQEAQLPQR